MLWNGVCVVGQMEENLYFNDWPIRRKYYTYYILKLWNLLLGKTGTQNICCGKCTKLKVTFQSN